MRIFNNKVLINIPKTIFIINTCKKKKISILIIILLNIIKF